MSLLDTSIARLDGTPTTVKDLTGGQPALIVNVASQCGLTPQYAQLEELHEAYAGRGFTVVGVPCDQFGGQEPGGAEEIAEFCSRTYGVTFPMTEKIEVNGEGQHPLFAELTKSSTASGKTGDVQWNFEKFLVDRDGTVVGRFSPIVPPNDPRVVEAIEKVL